MELFFLLFYIVTTMLSPFLDSLILALAMVFATFGFLQVYKRQDVLQIMQADKVDLINILMIASILLFCFLSGNEYRMEYKGKTHFLAVEFLLLTVYGALLVILLLNQPYWRRRLLPKTVWILVIATSHYTLCLLAIGSPNSNWVAYKLDESMRYMRRSGMARQPQPCAGLRKNSFIITERGIMIKIDEGFETFDEGMTLKFASICDFSPRAIGFDNFACQGAEDCAPGALCTDSPIPDIKICRKRGVIELNAFSQPDKLYASTSKALSNEMSCKNHKHCCFGDCIEGVCTSYGIIHTSKGGMAPCWIFTDTINLNHFKFWF